MKPKTKTTGKTSLRARAVDKSKEAKKGKAPATAVQADALHLIHELEVHQIELDMQNKELAQALADAYEADKAYRLYNDLYDFAPVGYFTLTPNGTILNVNLTGAKLLGLEQAELKDRRLGLFVSPASKVAFADFLNLLSFGRGIQTCDIEFLNHESGKPLWVTIEGTCFEGGRESRAVIIDINARKQTEEALRNANAYHRRLLEASPDPLVTIGPNGLITDANTAAELITGVAREQLIGDNFLKYFTEPEKAQEGYKQAFAEGFVKDYSLTIQHVSGRTTDVLFNASVYRNEEGELEGVFAAARDITERKLAEQAQRENELFIKSVLDSLSAQIAVLDENGVIVAVNEAWNKFAQENDSTDPHAYLGVNYLTVCETAYQHGDLSASQADLGIRSVLSGLRSQFTAEYSCDSPTEERCFTLTVVPQHKPRQGVIIIHQDVTEQKQAERALAASHLILKNALDLEKQLARIDPLTEINNRRSLFEAAEHECEIAARYEKPASVLMYDIDHFKDLNDTYGHTAGDLILQRITEIACHQLRTADVIGRYGGDEFVILLPMTKAEQAYPLAERIRAEVEAGSHPIPNGDIQVTISVGIVEMSLGESVENIFHRADAAMYIAKQTGRNRVVIGQPK